MFPRISCHLLYNLFLLLLLFIYEGLVFCRCVFLYILVFVIFNTRLTGSLASLRKHSMDITLNSYSLLSDTVDNMIAAKKNNALRLISERYEDALTQENNAQKNTGYSVLKFFY